ncbi:MAG: hypothetical protein QG579_506 [Patescibacteria group bacterium]|jgi:hypothetical protein|nr:hypothetical protein [Patescibacteria group bacterium]
MPTEVGFVGPSIMDAFFMVGQLFFGMALVVGAIAIPIYIWSSIEEARRRRRTEEAVKYSANYKK